jgi:hypothetical protein
MGSNLVAPTIFRNKPFGQQVEGLSHCGDETCAFERAVQTEDFEDAALFLVGGRLVHVVGKPYVE